MKKVLILMMKLDILELVELVPASGCVSALPAASGKYSLTQDATFKSNINVL